MPEIISIRVSALTPASIAIQSAVTRATVHKTQTRITRVDQVLTTSNRKHFT
jgi:hypothetical protein